MIHVYVAQWAGEALAVAESIDYPVFSIDVVPAMEFVATVQSEAAERHGDCRILLCAGGATFEAGAVTALDDALTADASLAVASAYLDGAPSHGPMNPNGVLLRESRLRQWGLDTRLRCYAWERVLAYRIEMFASAMPSGIAHVAAANMRTLNDDARAVALGSHYYDQLADDERAEAIVRGKL